MSCAGIMGCRLPDTTPVAPSLGVTLFGMGHAKMGDGTHTRHCHHQLGPARPQLVHCGI